MWKRDEQILRRLSRLSLSGYEDDFSKTICSSKRTSRPKFDLNSHLDEQMGNLPVAREWNYQKKRRNLGSFTGKSTWRKGRREDGKRLRVNWKSKLWPSLIHISRPNRQTICSSSGVKRLVTTNKRRVHTRRTILSSILSTVVIPQRSRYLFYLKVNF